jgi:hypothetical protein
MAGSVVMDIGHQAPLAFPVHWGLMEGTWAIGDPSRSDQVDTGMVDHSLAKAENAFTLEMLTWKLLLALAKEQLAKHLKTENSGMWDYLNPIIYIVLCTCSFS